MKKTKEKIMEPEIVCLIWEGNIPWLMEVVEQDNDPWHGGAA